ncbi:MAG: hypothetical protein GY749_22710 [Desulfobacteraceae bacterium]|nr:hypothetical protein [Desulfobacteraceae bacterium]
MDYFYTKNDKILEGPKRLPKTWKNTSGFNLQSRMELKSKGWIPQIKIGDDLPVLDTEIKEGPVNIINNDSVVSTWTVRKKTQTEINADATASESADIASHDKASRRFDRYIFNEIEKLNSRSPKTKKQFRSWWKNNVA